MLLLLFLQKTKNCIYTQQISQRLDAFVPLENKTAFTCNRSVNILMLSFLQKTKLHLYILDLHSYTIAQRTKQIKSLKVSSVQFIQSSVSRTLLTHSQFLERKMLPQTKHKKKKRKEEAYILEDILFKQKTFKHFAKESYPFFLSFFLLNHSNIRS